MRIFNRIQCILLCLMMLCAMCPAALAAETEADMLSASYTYSPAEERYTVYGAIQSNMGNTPILLTIKAPDGNFFTGFETTAEVTDNGTVYSFSPFNIPDNGVSGRYTLTVSVEFLSKKKDLYIDYYSIDDKFSLLQEVNSAILTNGDIHGLLTSVTPIVCVSYILLVWSSDNLLPSI